MTTPTRRDESSPRRWAVVGGGMLGLTLARRLAERGERVTLLEAAPELGGLASAWQLGDVTWDRHYHVTALTDTHLRRLLTELGLEQEMRWVETRTGFYTDGRLYSMSSSAEFISFPPLALWEKLRLAATIFYASKVRDWRRLEKILVADWLRRWSGNATFEKIWQPLLRAKLGDAYQQTSAAFIWASIGRMYRARRTGMKKEMFGYLPGGYARILDRFAEVLREQGVDIRVGRRVVNVESAATGPVTVHVAGAEPECFDRVVFTTPSAVIARVCPQLDASQRRRHEAIEYLGIICASALLDRPLSPYYVTNITDVSVPLTGVIEMTNVVDRRDLGGHTLVYLPKYVTADDPAWQWTDEEVRDRFLAALERMHPRLSRDDIAAFRISRVRHVMAIPTIEYSQRLPPMRTNVTGVYAINSAHIVKGNLNVNETVELAEQAFSELLEPEIGQPAAETACRANDDTVAHEKAPHEPTAREPVARP